MAKAAARPRKKKLKKTVVDALPTSTLLLTIQLSQLQTVKVMPCLGLPLVVLVSAVRVKVRRLLRKLQQSVLVKRLWNLV